MTPKNNHISGLGPFPKVRILHNTSWYVTEGRTHTQKKSNIIKIMDLKGREELPDPFTRAPINRGHTNTALLKGDKSLAEPSGAERRREEEEEGRRNVERRRERKSGRET